MGPGPAKAEESQRQSVLLYGEVSERAHDGFRDREAILSRMSKRPLTLLSAHFGGDGPGSPPARGVVF
jgi:hypothetical protein